MHAEVEPAQGDERGHQNSKQSQQPSPQLARIVRDHPPSHKSPYGERRERMPARKAETGFLNERSKNLRANLVKEKLERYHHRRRADQDRSIHSKIDVSPKHPQTGNDQDRNENDSPRRSNPRKTKCNPIEQSASVSMDIKKNGPVIHAEFVLRHLIRQPAKEVGESRADRQRDEIIGCDYPEQLLRPRGWKLLKDVLVVKFPAHLLMRYILNAYHRPSFGYSFRQNRPCNDRAAHPRSRGSAAKSRHSERRSYPARPPKGIPCGPRFSPLASRTPNNRSWKSRYSDLESDRTLRSPARALQTICHAEPPSHLRRSGNHRRGIEHRAIPQHKIWPYQPRAACVRASEALR